MRKKVLMILLAVILLLPGCSIFKDEEASASPTASRLRSTSTAAFNTQTGNKSTATTGTTATATTRVSTTKTIGSTTSNKDTIQLTMYYQDADGIIVPVTRKVVKQDAIARAALNGIIDSSTNREELAYYSLNPVLPQGTEILGIDIRQGTAVVDFNNKLLTYTNAAAERNIVSAIVYTLTEFSTINNVTIRVNGVEKKTLEYGTDVSGTLSRDDIMINNDKVNVQEDMVKSDVYLHKNINVKDAYFIPVSVEYEKVEDEDLPGKLVELYATDFDDEELTSEIPSGVKLLGSSLKSNVLTLDFNSEFISYGGGTAKENAILKQLLYTMKQIEDVEKIKILVDGKETTLPEGTDIKNGLSIPTSINMITD